MSTQHNSNNSNNASKAKISHNKSPSNSRVVEVPGQHRQIDKLSSQKTNNNNNNSNAGSNHRPHHSSNINVHDDGDEENSCLDSMYSKMFNVIARTFAVPLISATDDFSALLRKVFVISLTCFGMFGALIPAIYYSVYAGLKPKYNYPKEVYGTEQEQLICIIVLAACFFALAGLGLPCYIYLVYTKTMTPLFAQIALMFLAAILIATDLCSCLVPLSAVAIVTSQFAYVTKVPYPSLVNIPLVLYCAVAQARFAWNPHLTPVDWLRIPGAYFGQHSAERFVHSFMSCFVAYGLVVGLSVMMVKEFDWHVDGAHRSAFLAHKVSTSLISYDTEKCRKLLDQAAKNAVRSRHEFGSIVSRLQELRILKDKEDDEEENSNNNNHNNNKKHEHAPAATTFSQYGVSEDLCNHFRKMCDNLDRYRPHIPQWAILELTEDEIEMMSDPFPVAKSYAETLRLRQNKSNGSSNNNLGKAHRSKNSNHGNDNKWSDDEGEHESEGDLSREGHDEDDEEESDNDSNGSHTSAKSDMSMHQQVGAGNARHSSRMNGKFRKGDNSNIPETNNNNSGLTISELAKLNNSEKQKNKSEAEKTSKNNKTKTAAANKNGRKRATSTKKNGVPGFGGMLQPHVAPLSGAIVDRIVCGRLNFSRVSELVFGDDLRSFLNLAPNLVNDLISSILDHAVTQDATVHAVLGDVFFVSWNATLKITHSDMKACRFLTQVPELMRDVLKKTATALFLKKANADSRSTSTQRLQQLSLAQEKTPTTTKLTVGARLRLQQEEEDAAEKAEQEASAVLSDESGEHGRTSGAMGGGGLIELKNVDDCEVSGGPLSGLLLAETEEDLWCRRLQQLLTDIDASNLNLVFGAAVSGSAWCQVAGHSSRVAFLLSVFSHERVLDEAMRCAIKGGFFVVCRHIQSNAAHEYYLRGCSVLPYAHLMNAFGMDSCFLGRTTADSSPNALTSANYNNSHRHVTSPLKMNNSSSSHNNNAFGRNNQDGASLAMNGSANYFQGNNSLRVPPPTTATTSATNTSANNNNNNNQNTSPSRAGVGTNEATSSVNTHINNTDCDRINTNNNPQQTPKNIAAAKNKDHPVFKVEFVIEEEHQEAEETQKSANDNKRSSLFHQKRETDDKGFLIPGGSPAVVKSPIPNFNSSVSKHPHSEFGPFAGTQLQKQLQQRRQSVVNDNNNNNQLSPLVPSSSGGGGWEKQRFGKAFVMNTSFSVYPAMNNNENNNNPHTPIATGANNSGNNNNNSLNNNNAAMTQPQNISTTNNNQLIASPLYELIGKKEIKHGTNDEWLYQLAGVVGPASTNAGPSLNKSVASFHQSNNNNASGNGVTSPLNSATNSSIPLGLDLCSVVALLARANVGRAMSVIEKMIQDEPQVVLLDAYRMVTEMIPTISKLAQNMDLTTTKTPMQSKRQSICEGATATPMLFSSKNNNENMKLFELPSSIACEKKITQPESEAVAAAAAFNNFSFGDNNCVPSIAVNAASQPSQDGDNSSAKDQFGNRVSSQHDSNESKESKESNDFNTLRQNYYSSLHQHHDHQQRQSSEETMEGNENSNNNHNPRASQNQTASMQRQSSQQSELHHIALDLIKNNSTITQQNSDDPHSVPE